MCDTEKIDTSAFENSRSASSFSSLLYYVQSKENANIPLMKSVDHDQIIRMDMLVLSVKELAFWRQLV